MASSMKANITIINEKDTGDSFGETAHIMSEIGLITAEMERVPLSLHKAILPKAPGISTG